MTRSTVPVASDAQGDLQHRRGVGERRGARRRRSPRVRRRPSGGASRPPAPPRPAPRSKWSGVIVTSGSNAGPIPSSRRTSVIAHRIARRHRFVVRDDEPDLERLSPTAGDLDGIRTPRMTLDRSQIVDAELGLSLVEPGEHSQEEVREPDDPVGNGTSDRRRGGAVDHRGIELADRDALHDFPEHRCLRGARRVLRVVAELPETSGPVSGVELRRTARRALDDARRHLVDEFVDGATSVLHDVGEERQGQLDDPGGVVRAADVEESIQSAVEIARVQLTGGDAPTTGPRSRVLPGRSRPSARRTAGIGPRGRAGGPREVRTGLDPERR